MIDQALNDPGTRRTFEEEWLLGEAAENISALIQSANLSQRQLAERLGVSESRVSQILSGENLTLKSLASLGWALGIRFQLDPVAMTSTERKSTPAAGDPPAPDWLSRLRPTARYFFVQSVPTPKRKLQCERRNNPRRRHLRIVGGRVAA